METSGITTIIVLFFVSPGFLYGIYNVVSFSYAQEIQSRNVIFTISKAATTSEIDVTKPYYNSMFGKQNMSNPSHSNIIYELYATVIVLPLALLVLIILYKKKKI